MKTIETIETIVGLFFLAVVMVIAHEQSSSVKSSVANNGANREPPLAVLSDKIIVKRYYLRKT